MIALSLALACRPAAPPPTASEPTPAPTQPETTTQTVLTVSSYRSGRIHVFEPSSGTLLGTIRDVPGAQTVVASPDGTWLAVAEELHQIVRVDPIALEVVDVVVGDDPETPEDESGGLVHPDAVTFGPDGRLYVASFDTDQVLRYEADGTFVDVFVAAGAGGLDGPDLGLSFDAGGVLLAPGWSSDRIHRYDADGAWIDDLLGPDDGLDRPRAIASDPSGQLLVSSWGSSEILRLEPGGGATALIQLPQPTGMVLDEASGQLLVASDGDDQVHAFDPETGGALGVRIALERIDGATALSLLSRPVQPD